MNDPTSRENASEGSTPENLPPLAVFHRLRAQAQWRFDYEVCHQAACRKRRFCTGGPRGMFRRHKVPACMIVNLIASGGDAARLLAECEAERKDRQGKSGGRAW